MRYAATLLCVFVLGGVASADHTVFLTWEGYVNAPATLRVHGDRVQVDSSAFAAVSGESFRFVEAMPVVGRDIRVNVRQGSGTVQILEQPTRRNDETLVVRINPGTHGGERYVLEFTSDRLAARDNLRRQDQFGERSRARGASSGEVTWSGRVDYEALITLRDRRAIATAVRGRPITGQRAHFSARMPNGPSQVELVGQRGRGEIVILEQPSEANDYSAKIRIFDEPDGDDLYQFTLRWNDAGDTTSGVFDTAPPPRGAPGINRIVWRGQVDGRIRLSIQGNRSWVDRLSGGPVANAQVDFGNPLPRTSNVNVRKLTGREDIEVVEQPSASNGYKLVIEIDDNDAGADEYAIEVNW